MPEFYAVQLQNRVTRISLDQMYNYKNTPLSTDTPFKANCVKTWNNLPFDYFFYLTLILLRLFQQHYCYNVTGQSQESEGSCKPARIKEVHSKLHSFQASLCTLTATHLTHCTYIRLSVLLGCLIYQLSDSTTLPG